jgi:ribosomal-protein-alanine N-acetyltransferase
MEAAEARAKALGATMATLEVRRSNTPAIGLYDSLGYRQVGVRKRYYPPNGEDALVMNKALD